MKKIEINLPNQEQRIVDALLIQVAVQKEKPVGGWIGIVREVRKAIKRALEQDAKHNAVGDLFQANIPPLPWSTVASYRVSFWDWRIVVEIPMDFEYEAILEYWCTQKEIEGFKIARTSMVENPDIPSMRRAIKEYTISKRYGTDVKYRMASNRKGSTCKLNYLREGSTTDPVWEIICAKGAEEEAI